MLFDGGDVVSRGVRVNILVRGWVKNGRQVLFSSLMIGLGGGGGLVYNILRAMDAPVHFVHPSSSPLKTVAAPPPPLSQLLPL
jgi:hypothetical protein